MARYRNDTIWGETHVEYYGTPPRANIASAIARYHITDQQSPTGELIHVTGASYGPEDTKALTLQYRLPAEASRPFDREWHAFWPTEISPATEGLGVALTRGVFPQVNPACTIWGTPVNNDAVFLAAAAYQPSNGSWSLGTVKYNTLPVFQGGLKDLSWERVRHGQHGDDIPVGICNLEHVEGDCRARVVWPIGRSVGPGGNESVLSTMYRDESQ